MAIRHALIIFLLAVVAVGAKGEFEVSLNEGYTTQSAFSECTNVLSSLASNGGKRRLSDATSATAAALLQELSPAGPGRASFSGSYIPSPEYLSKLTDFLAQSSTGAALAANAKLNAAAGISRAQLCQDIKSGKWSSKVVSCYCSQSQSLLHCQALSLQELQKAIAAVPKLPTTVTRGLPIVPRAGSCNFFSELESRLNVSKNGCIGGFACGTSILNVLTVNATIDGGCYPDLQLNNLANVAGQTLSRWTAAGLPFSKNYTLTEASKLLKTDFRSLTMSKFRANLKACITIPALDSVFKFLGLSPCGNAEAKVTPFISRVGLNAYVGNKTQGHAGVRGDIQYINANSNPICRLGKYDSYWSCKTYCNWGLGEGRLEAYTGGKLLGYSIDRKIPIVSTPLPSCAVSAALSVVKAP